MVYEVKCDNCGDIIDFGGEDPEEKPIEQSKIPPNAIEFDDSVYCESCVKEFVEFGIGDVEERIDFLEEQVEDLKKELGLSKEYKGV
jgi:hypothetical protein